MSLSEDEWFELRSSGLAERSSRGSDPDFRRFVLMAPGSASEVECQLLLARDWGFLVPALQQALETDVQQLKRMLIRLGQKLRANGSKQ